MPKSSLQWTARSPTVTKRSLKNEQSKAMYRRRDKRDAGACAKKRSLIIPANTKEFMINIEPIRLSKPMFPNERAKAAEEWKLWPGA
jgi:hypothetical protein